MPSCRGRPRSKIPGVSKAAQCPPPLRCSKYGMNIWYDCFKRRRVVGIREAGCCARGKVSSYLAGGDELERSQRALHVRDVGLEVVESIGDARLDLGGVLPRRAVGSDLVQGGRRHFGGSVGGCRCVSSVSFAKWRFRFCWRKNVDGDKRDALSRIRDRRALSTFTPEQHRTGS